MRVRSWILYFEASWEIAEKSFAVRLSFLDNLGIATPSGSCSDSAAESVIHGLENFPYFAGMLQPAGIGVFA